MIVYVQFQPRDKRSHWLSEFHFWWDLHNHTNPSFVENNLQTIDKQLNKLDPILDLNTKNILDVNEIYFPYLYLENKDANHDTVLVVRWY